MFRQYLQEAAEEFEVAINSYVLMSNHVHLLLTPADSAGISKALHSSSRRYSGYFNTVYGRTGHLWECRFHAATIANDAYFLACHRYIDMNPVRAGMVERPEHYRWSSHRHYALGAPDSIVSPHRAIDVLGTTPESRRRAYRALFEKEADDREFRAIREASRAGRAVDGGTVPFGRPRKKKCA